MKNLLLNIAAALVMASFGAAFLAVDERGVTDDPFLMGLAVLLACLAAPIYLAGELRR